MFTKKILYLWFNDKGTIFPWVAGMSSLLILVTTFSIQLYRNEILSTEAFRTSLMHQSIFEVAYSQHRLTLAEKRDNFNTPFTYTTPLGEAMTLCTLQETNISCAWTISDSKGVITKILTTHDFPSPL